MIVVFHDKTQCYHLQQSYTTSNVLWCSDTRHITAVQNIDMKKIIIWELWSSLSSMVEIHK